MKVQKKLDFETIYNNTYKDILSYIIIKTNNINDVNDILQDTYVAFYKILKKGILINDVKSYLIGIVNKKISRYYKLNYRFKIKSLFEKEELSIYDKLESNINLENEIISSIQIEDIWKFLKKKKDIITKIFYLYYYLGFSIKDIAFNLKITESTVKNYLYRTLNELKLTFRKED